MEDEGREWFVGVDWASQTHHVFVIDAKGRKLGERGFVHGGEGLAEMAAWIVKQTGTVPDAVSVAIEVPHGPVVESLMEQGFRVHSINPKQLDRFRDRFSPAGAKDDSRDAQQRLGQRQHPKRKTNQSRDKYRAPANIPSSYGAYTNDACPAP